MVGLKFFRCDVCGEVIVQGECESSLEFGRRVWYDHMLEHKETNEWPKFTFDVNRAWQALFHPLALVSGDRVSVVIAA